MEKVIVYYLTENELGRYFDFTMKDFVFCFDIDCITTDIDLAEHYKKILSENNLDVEICRKTLK